MGDEHHRDAGFRVETPDGVQHLAPPHRVQHGGGLIQHDAPGPHGQHPGDGHPLLLPAGQQVGGVVRHAHGFQGGVHPLPDLRGGHAQVFRAEGHVLLHHAGHDLVVRVLEHHAHPAADVQQVFLAAGVQAVHVNLAPGGQEDGVEVLGQGGFARAVVAQHRHKLPRPDGQGEVIQHRGGDPLPGGVAEGEVFGLEDGLGHKQLPRLGRIEGMYRELL